MDCAHPPLGAHRIREANVSVNHSTETRLDRYQTAVKNLSAFVVERARETARIKGFGWTAQPDAPDTYSKLKMAHEISSKTKIDLPVSSLYCDSVIFEAPQVNHAFRFWHDTLHVETGLTFAHAHELELSMHHMKLAERAGLSRNSLEYRLLHTDLVGQNYLIAVAGRFALHQKEFVMGCLVYGMEEGLLREIHKEVS